MKLRISLVMCWLTPIALQAQCDAVSIQVSSSDSAYVQLYHAGFFLFGADENTGGFDNVCSWTVTTMAGDVIHEAETTGAWADQSFMLFDHELTVADSMQVELRLSSPLEDEDCCIADTLVWVETEVIPGFPFGNWEVLGQHVGQLCQANSISALSSTASLQIWPQPAAQFFSFDVPPTVRTLLIFDLRGKQLATFQASPGERSFDISGLPSGTFIVALFGTAPEVPARTLRLVKE
jgi:hypothetical protein